MSYIFDHFVGPFAALMVIFGLSAFFSNSIVFTLLVKKQEGLLSCECLVALKCILSALYGIVLMIPGLTYFLSEHSLLNRIKQNASVYCFIHYAIYNFIIHACLGLVLLIAINRYAAVKLAVNYRTIFSRSRTCIAIIILLTVASVHAVPDFCSCRYETIKEYSSGIGTYYVFIKAILLLACTIMMFYVYRVISVFFSEPFWSPVRRIFSLACKFPCCARQPANQQDPQNPANAAETADRIYLRNTRGGSLRPKSTLRQQKLNRHFSLSTNTGNKQSSSNHHEEVDNFDEVGQLNAECVNLNQIHLANNINQSSAINPEDNGPCSFGGQANSQNSSNNASDKSNNQTPTSNLEMVGRFQKVLKSSEAQTQALYMRRRRRRLRSRHQITATMFFACVVFLCVTFPNSLYEVIVTFLPEKWVPKKISMDVWLVTSMLYGLLFILNPFLFTCNDKRMRKQLCKLFTCFALRQKIAKLIPNCCKLSPQPTEV